MVAIRVKIPPRNPDPRIRPPPSMWRTIKWLLSPDCRFDDTVSRAMLIVAVATAALGVALIGCQTTSRSGRQRPPDGSSRWHFRYLEDDGVVGYGWPLIAHTSEWRLPTDGGRDDRWHPLAVAIDAAISLLILASPLLLAWRWLRSPRRFAFRLSTLLIATTALAITLAFANFEREYSFAVLRWMHPALDCRPSGDRIEALMRVPSLAGVACATFAVLVTACDAARRYHARRFSPKVLTSKL